MIEERKRVRKERGEKEKLLFDVGLAKKEGMGGDKEMAMGRTLIPVARLMLEKGPPVRDGASLDNGPPPVTAHPFAGRRSFFPNSYDCRFPVGHTRILDLSCLST